MRNSDFSIGKTNAVVKTGSQQDDDDDDDKNSPERVLLGHYVSI